MKISARIPLDLLETLKVFAESPNISVAAKTLGVSQPAVSQQLKRLQEELPQPLFVFQGRKKVLSHYGRSLYQTLHEKLPEIDRSIERVNLLYAEPKDLRLRVGARREVIVGVSERLNFPGRVVFVSLANEEILRKLRSGEIDVGITWEKPNDPNILAKPLFTQGTKLCVPKSFLKKSDLNLKTEATKEFLKEAPCLAYKENEAPFLLEWCRSTGIDIGSLNVRRVADDWNAIARMLEVQAGWSIMPMGIAVSEEKVWVQELPKTVVPEQTFYQLYSTSLRHLSAIKSLFVI